MEVQNIMVNCHGSDMGWCKYDMFAVVYFEILKMLLVVIPTKRKMFSKPGIDWQGKFEEWGCLRIWNPPKSHGWEEMKTNIKTATILMFSQGTSAMIHGPHDLNRNLRAKTNRIVK